VGSVVLRRNPFIHARLRLSARFGSAAQMLAVSRRFVGVRAAKAACCPNIRHPTLPLARCEHAYREEVDSDVDYVRPGRTGDAVQRVGHHVIREGAALVPGFSMGGTGFRSSCRSCGSRWWIRHPSSTRLHELQALQLQAPTRCYDGRGDSNIRASEVSVPTPSNPVAPHGGVDYRQAASSRQSVARKIKEGTNRRSIPRCTWPLSFRV
jgi:hypothetical protein